MSEELERARWAAWEQGFRAGAGPLQLRPKNPYSYDGVERPSPPKFPELYFRMDENPQQSAERWTRQMREFKAAWDKWSAGLR